MEVAKRIISHKRAGILSGDMTEFTDSSDGLLGKLPDDGSSRLEYDGAGKAARVANVTERAGGLLAVRFFKNS